MPQDPGKRRRESPTTSLSRLQWWVYSVPLFLKMLGIVVLVSTIFGSLVYHQVRNNIRRTHDQMHIQTAMRAAALLAANLERLDLVEDVPLISQAIASIVKTFPDVSYVLVLDAKQEVLAYHLSFTAEIPPDLPRQADQLCTACHPVPDRLEIAADLLEGVTEPDVDVGQFRRYARTMGSILEVTVPIVGRGGAGVRVGYGDTSISREMGVITSALIRSLTVCIVIGQGLALVLTYLLVHPILNLVQVTNAIGDGDFASRARVYSQDEIGKLARMFNLMAEKLQAYQAEVEEREAFRTSLIDQIVQAQEEERISVARELHDQLGQSLYKVLLLYQGIQRDCGARNRRCMELEEDLRGLIDDVRRLAWGIRPSLLDDFGLDSALQQYLKETSSRAGLPIDYKCGFPVNALRLPGRVEVILYRIAQEAITNVVRHANANRASVVLLRHNSEVTLLVEDDGQGFDVRSVFQGNMASLGLTGMKERVALVGGDLTIDSQPGKGAAVRVRIPYNGDS